MIPNILEYFNVTSGYEALLFISNILSQSHVFGTQRVHCEIIELVHNAFGLIGFPFLLFLVAL